MNKKLHLINGKQYLPIFPEFAEFLVNKTTIDVFYLHDRTSQTKPTKLTATNLYHYITILDGNARLFACMGELPDIKLSLYTNDNSIEIKPIYESYKYLYWGD